MCLQRLGGRAEVSRARSRHHQPQEPEHPSRNHLELMIDACALALSGEEKAMTARERLELRPEDKTALAASPNRRRATVPDLCLELERDRVCLDMGRQYPSTPCFCRNRTATKRWPPNWWAASVSTEGDPRDAPGVRPVVRPRRSLSNL